MHGLTAEDTVNPPSRILLITRVPEIVGTLIDRIGLTEYFAVRELGSEPAELDQAPARVIHPYPKVRFDGRTRG